MNRVRHRLTGRTGTALQYDAAMGVLVAFDDSMSPRAEDGFPMNVWVAPEALEEIT